MLREIPSLRGSVFQPVRNVSGNRKRISSVKRCHLKAAGTGAGMKLMKTKTEV